MGGSRAADELTKKIVKLLPDLYNDFRVLLESYKIEQIAILDFLYRHGGRARRPDLSSHLCIDPKQAFYLIDPLRQRGLIRTERIGRIAIDEITETGNREYTKMKAKIYSFIERLITEIL